MGMLGENSIAKGRKAAAGNWKYSIPFHSPEECPHCKIFSCRETSGSLLSICCWLSRKKKLRVLNLSKIMQTCRLTHTCAFMNSHQGITSSELMAPGLSLSLECIKLVRDERWPIPSKQKQHHGTLIWWKETGITWSPSLGPLRWKKLCHNGMVLCTVAFQQLETHNSLSSQLTLNVSKKNGQVFRPRFGNCLVRQLAWYH